ncbi:MAG: methylated-DNA--[protein]-cysteine S-methyltransferase [Chitinophagia bacterium]|nr:methylated-DNA--[protein]-cysteine S-methyltransferase [Chitinophagia bacterium]
MTEQELINYDRVAQAIAYIQAHYKDQPDLDVVAEQVHLSPFHFQRLFTDWAGVSPKKFLQYITVAHAKAILKGQQATVFETAIETGLSGTSRLHDMFVHIEGMTPGEYKNGGAGLHINYSFAPTPFGQVVVAATGKGVCHMAFASSQQEALDVLQQQFPRAQYSHHAGSHQQEALRIFTEDWGKPGSIKLHLKGTEFQLKVWETLLKIPVGRLTTYGQLSAHIAHPGASRAVGTAIGNNPVAFLIPCHRVIQSTGLLGGYMWGTTRKAAIIGWEAARIS